MAYIFHVFPILRELVKADYTVKGISFAVTFSF